MNGNLSGENANRTTVSGRLLRESLLPQALSMVMTLMALRMLYPIHADKSDHLREAAEDVENTAEQDMVKQRL